MGELLDSLELMKPLRRGDVVHGIVMRSDPEGVLINIGHKAEGIVPPAEMRTLDREGLERLKVGDEIVTLVVKGDSAEGASILSIDRAIGEQGWQVLQKAMESGTLVEGKVQGFNRGGAIVEAEGVQGFVPMSQLVSVSRDRFRRMREPEGSADADAGGGDTNADRGSADSSGQGSAQSDGDEQREAEEIGKVLQLKVLEVARSRNRAIFSERQAIQEMREQRKARLIEELTEGEVRRGRVTGISGFGAFVDLGGADGLIHISELSWNTVSSPEEVVKVGDELDVYVLRVDAENNKIALSLKRLQQEPWETIGERYAAGDIVDAVVTKLTEFGAFARVEGSVEGLIHISELTSKIISHPSEAIAEGEAVRVKILRIEPERRRLGLSLRQAAEEEEEAAAEEEEPAAEEEEEPAEKEEEEEEKEESPGRRRLGLSLRQAAEEEEAAAEEEEAAAEEEEEPAEKEEKEEES